MSTYLFEKPLIRGTMLKRKSQFTALVDKSIEEINELIPILTCSDLDKVKKEIKARL